MSKEKQIDEMAKALNEETFGVNMQTLADHLKPETINKVAEYLYNAGYRKQKEGEWVANRHISVSKRNRTIHYETYKCSVCGTWNGRHRQKYCPNCGAKIKGGAE